MPADTLKKLGALAILIVGIGLYTGADFLINCERHHLDSLPKEKRNRSGLIGLWIFKLVILVLVAGGSCLIIK
jgi:hypothetical protein